MQIRENSFGFLVQVLARRIDAKMKVRLSEAGVEFKLFPNLVMLLQEDGINQRQLGDKLGFPEYAVSRNIDALIKVGLAERRPDPNSRRSQLIFLTGKGRETAENLPRIIAENNDESLQALSETEREILMQLLRKVAKF